MGNFYKNQPPWLSTYSETTGGEPYGGLLGVFPYSWVTVPIVPDESGDQIDFMDRLSTGGTLNLKFALSLSFKMSYTWYWNKGQQIDPSNTFHDSTATSEDTVDFTGTAKMPISRGWPIAGYESTPSIFSPGFQLSSPKPVSFTVNGSWDGVMDGEHNGQMSAYMNFSLLIFRKNKVVYYYVYGNGGAGWTASAYASNPDGASASRFDANASLQFNYWSASNPQDQLPEPYGSALFSGNSGWTSGSTAKPTSDTATFRNASLEIIESGYDSVALTSGEDHGLTAHGTLDFNVESLSITMEG